MQMFLHFDPVTLKHENLSQGGKLKEEKINYKYKAVYNRALHQS